MLKLFSVLLASRQTRDVHDLAAEKEADQGGVAGAESDVEAEVESEDEREVGRDTGLRSLMVSIL